jgi:ribose transport system permease protein
MVTIVHQTKLGNSRLRTILAPSRIGGVYALVVLIIVFSLWVPHTFPATSTIYQIANSNALPALAALTLVLPLAAGVFDISITYTMSLSGVLCTYAIVDWHLPIGVAIVLGILAALVCGLINACVVVFGKIESLVATLATGFLIQSVVLWITNSSSITSSALTGTFQKIAYSAPFGTLTAPVIYALVLAFVIWWILEHTATGRRIYATGFSKEAARLATVPTARIQFAALVVSAFTAGVTGIVLASTLGSGSPTAGDSYLLPAFAGVFVGATQLRPGRFNAWGTVLAVILLGTLTTGLGLASVPQWTQQFATGIVLVAALILAGKERRMAGVAGVRRRLRRQPQEQAENL